MKKTFLRKKTLSISKKTSEDEKDERNIYLKLNETTTLKEEKKNVRIDNTKKCFIGWLNLGFQICQKRASFFDK